MKFKKIKLNLIYCMGNYVYLYIIKMNVYIIMFLFVYVYYFFDIKVIFKWGYGIEFFGFFFYR